MSKFSRQAAKLGKSHRSRGGRDTAARRLPSAWPQVESCRRRHAEGWRRFRSRHSFLLAHSECRPARSTGQAVLPYRRCPAISDSHTACGEFRPVVVGISSRRSSKRRRDMASGIAVTSTEVTGNAVSGSEFGVSWISASSPADCCSRPTCRPRSLARRSLRCWMKALIGVVHELQVPEKPLAPRLRFGDGLAQGSRAYFPLALGVGVHLVEAPGEEAAPVCAEHAEVLDPFKGAGPGWGSARERYAREAGTRHSNRRWATHTGPTGPVRRCRRLAHEVHGDGAGRADGGHHRVLRGLTGRRGRSAYLAALPTYRSPGK